VSRRRLTWTPLGIVAAASCGSLRPDADTHLAVEGWETSPNVSFLHPGGHEYGWDEVKRNIY